jgi:hypothetical protein
MDGTAQLPGLAVFRADFRKWGETSIHEWITKATSPDLKPPKSKHIRRILIYHARDPSIPITETAKFMITNRPGGEDPRVAAKCLSILLTLLQCQSNPGSELEIVDCIGRWRLDVTPADPKLHVFARLASACVPLIRHKIAFHRSHGDVRGNFAPVNKGAATSAISDLTRYLTLVLADAELLQSAVLTCDEFAGVVLWQPFAAETVGAYRLLKAFGDNKDTAALLAQAEGFIAKLTGIPYISSSIDLPKGKQVDAPRELFPFK